MRSNILIILVFIISNIFQVSGVEELNCSILNSLNEDESYLCGLELSELGRIEDAIFLYNRAIAINNSYLDAWYKKLDCLVALGRCEEVEDCCYEISKIIPPDAAYDLKGTSLKECYKDHWPPTHVEPVEEESAIDDYEYVIGCFNESIEINQNYTSAWNNKGVALGELGRYEESLLCFNKAIEINSSIAEAWNNRGVTLDYLKEHQEAMDSYNRSIDIDPLLSEAWYNKGSTLIRHFGRYEEAGECYNRSIYLDPELKNVNKQLLYAETYYAK